MMVRKRELSRETEEKIIMLRRAGHGADSICDLLIEGGVPELPGGGTRNADVKWIQRLLVRLDVKDTSGPWSFEESDDPEEARHVLDVLAHVIKQSESRILRLTNDEAKWIIRLRGAYPQMPEPEVWRWIQKYLHAQQSGGDTGVLDAMIAFRGWESQENQVAQQMASAQAWVNRGYGTIRRKGNDDEE